VIGRITSRSGTHDHAHSGRRWMVSVKTKRPFLNTTTDSMPQRSRLQPPPKIIRSSKRAPWPQGIDRDARETLCLQPHSVGQQLADEQPLHRRASQQPAVEGQGVALQFNDGYDASRKSARKRCEGNADIAIGNKELWDSRVQWDLLLDRSRQTSCIAINDKPERASQDCCGK
jgi:hypothetical protein